MGEGGPRDIAVSIHTYTHTRSHGVSSYPLAAVPDQADEGVRGERNSRPGHPGPLLAASFILLECPQTHTHLGLGQQPLPRDMGVGRTLRVILSWLALPQSTVHPIHPPGKAPHLPPPSLCGSLNRSQKPWSFLSREETRLGDRGLVETSR